MKVTKKTVTVQKPIFEDEYTLVLNQREALFLHKLLGNLCFSDIVKILGKEFCKENDVTNHDMYMTDDMYYSFNRTFEQNNGDDV